MTEALDQLEAAVESLHGMPSDDETADYLGRLDHAIRRLTQHRKAIMDELPGPVSGSAYRVTESRSATRSYNTPALLRDFAKAGLSVEDLILTRALSYQWHWTELHREAIRADIGLRIAGHEVSEDEADHVGETWKSTFKVEAVDVSE